MRSRHFPQSGGWRAHGTRVAAFRCMRVAAPSHDGRISPVFDVAQSFVVLESRRGGITVRSEVRLDDADYVARARRIGTLGWDVLICGAISRPLEVILNAAGVRVIGSTCGPVDDMLAAFLAGELTNAAFLMPGCLPRRQRLDPPSMQEVHASESRG